MERYIKNIYQGIGVDTIIFLLTMAINFLIIPIYLKFISLEELGIYFSIQGIIAVISLADIGLSMYSVKKLSDDSFFNSLDLVPYLHSAQIFQYVLGILLLFFGWGISYYVSITLKIDNEYAMITQKLFLFSWLSVVVSIWFGINYAILQSRHRLVIANIALFSTFLISCILNIYFLYIGYGIDYFGISLFISTVSVNLFISYKVFQHYSIVVMAPKIFNINYVRDGWNYVKQFQLLRVAQVAKTSLFTVLLSYYGGQTIVAQYNISNKLPQLVPSFISKIIMNFFPSLSALFASGEKEAIKNMYQKIFQFGFIMMLFALCGIYFLDELFVELWVGQEKFIGNNLFIYILLSFIVFSINSFVGIIIQASGEFRKLPFLSFAEVAIFCILSFILFYYYGLIGFFIGYICSIFISLFYSLVLINKLLHINILHWAIISTKKVVLPICTIIICNIFINYIFSSLWLKFFAISLIFLIIFFNTTRKYRL